MHWAPCSSWHIDLMLRVSPVRCQRHPYVKILTHDNVLDDLVTSVPSEKGGVQMAEQDQIVSTCHPVCHLRDLGGAQFV